MSSSGASRLKSLRWLANLATLLFLAVTIFGLISTFRSVGAVSDPAMKARILSSGLSDAMNNAAVGFGVALVCMVGHVIGRRARRLNLSIDLALFAALYGAYAWEVFPPLSAGYRADGPFPTSVVFTLTHLIQRYTWAIVLGVGGVAAVELRFAFRPWVLGAGRAGAALGLLFLLCAPGLLPSHRLANGLAGSGDSKCDDRPEAPPTVSRKLSAPESVGGFLWPAGTDVTTQRSVLVSASVKLGEAAAIGTATWPAGATVTYSTSRGLAAEMPLGKPERLEGFDTATGNTVTFVWPAGALVMLNSRAQVVRVQIPLADGGTWAGLVWPAGTIVLADASGTVRGASWHTQNPATFDGVTWPADTTVDIDPDTAKPKSGSVTLGAPRTYGGVAWPAHTWLRFDAQARVISAIANFDIETTWHGHRFPAGTILVLSPNGDVLADPSRHIMGDFPVPLSLPRAGAGPGSP